MSLSPYLGHAPHNTQALVLGPELKRQAEEGLAWDMPPVVANQFPNSKELSSCFRSIENMSFEEEYAPQDRVLPLRKLGIGISATLDDYTVRIFSLTLLPGLHRCSQMNGSHDIEMAGELRQVEPAGHRECSMSSAAGNARDSRTEAFQREW